MTLMMNKVDKNSVFFRFSHDSSIVEKVEFYGREIAVGDLKQAISDMKSIAKYDLVLVNEGTKEVYARDGMMVARNMCVTVRRTPLQNTRKAAVVHVGDLDISSPTPAVSTASKKVEPEEPIKKHGIPPEYLCPLCRDLFDDPHIALCCGRSACFGCLSPGTAGHDSGKACPLCSATWTRDTRPVPNPRLADTVASLNLDYFVLPQDSKKRKQIKEEPVEPASNAHDGMAAPGVEPSSRPRLPPTLPCTWQLPVPPPPPPGLGAAAVRPCMLSQEQFLAWQQSLRDAGSESSSSSVQSGARRRRGRGHGRKKRHGVAASPFSGSEAEEKSRKKRTRR